MDKVYNFFLNWVLQAKLAGLVKSLSGYTTYLGVLLSVITIVIWVAAGMPAYEAAMKYLMVLVKLGIQDPLSLEEKQAAVNAVIVLLGILGKLWKFATGKPQVPKAPKPVLPAK